MKSLLIVDDDVPLLDSLRFVFRGLYDVRTAQTAEEAAGLLARALRLGDLRRRVEELEQELARAPRPREAGGQTMKDALEDYERSLIQGALERAGGVQTRAAQILGTTRRILRYRMEKLAIPSVEA